MRTIDFSPLFRHSVGFDRMQRLLDSAAQAEQSTAYPHTTSSKSVRTVIK